MHKNFFRICIYLNIQGKTIELLEENAGEYLFDQ